MTHRYSSRVALGFACATLALGGCGDRLVDVSGRVTYNGSPLKKPDGKIVFVGPKGSQVVAPIGQDGTYEAAKVPAGINRVAVYYPNPEFKKSKRFPVKQKSGAPPPPPPPPMPSPFLTPYQYTSPDTSNLSVEVKDGTVYNPELTGPKIP